MQGNYCSIKEAYGVESLTGSGKRREKKGCGVPGSAGQASPYDLYTPNTGREQAKIGNEHFVGANEEENQTTYKSKAADYIAYCRSHGICSPVEAFENSKQQAKSTPVASCMSGSYQNPRYADIADAWTPEMKNLADKAFQANLAADPDRIPMTPTMPQRKVDMTHVGGYIDEELEAYLSVVETKSQPNPTLFESQQASSGAKMLDHGEPVVQKWQDGSNVPSAKAKDQYKPGAKEPSLSGSVGNYSKDPNRRPVSRWQNAMDLMLFTFSGILLIFLCEQLYRLATYYGMKQTMHSLEPIFELLQEYIKEKTNK